MTSPPSTLMTTTGGARQLVPRRRPRVQAPRGRVRAVVAPKIDERDPRTGEGNTERAEDREGLGLAGGASPRKASPCARALPSDLPDLFVRSSARSRVVTAC